MVTAENIGANRAVSPALCRGRFARARSPCSRTALSTEHHSCYFFPVSHLRKVKLGKVREVVRGRRVFKWDPHHLRNPSPFCLPPPPHLRSQRVLALGNTSECGSFAKHRNELMCAERSAKPVAGGRSTICSSALVFPGLGAACQAPLWPDKHGKWPIEAWGAGHSHRW